MPLSDEEKEMLDELGGLLSGLLESGKSSVKDEDMGLLSVVPNKLRDSYYYEGTGMKDMGYHSKNLVEDSFFLSISVLPKSGTELSEGSYGSLLSNLLGFDIAS